MEERNPNNNQQDEIDLSFIFQKIGDFFKNLLIGFLKIINFYYKRRWILLTLLVIGAILGYILENSFRSEFKNNFIVTANYGSSDYLYNKIDAVDSKINLIDSTFLKKAFGEHYLKVNSIEIEPIINIYNFIGQSESNQELFELLSEDKEMSEFIKDPVNSRNYPHHTINLIIEGENENIHKLITGNFFDYLNSNQYYNNSKRISLKNTLLQITQNQKVREQIDAVVNSVANQGNTDGKNPMVSIKENRVIDALLKRKDFTLNEDRKLQTKLKNKQKVIQVVDANYQIEFEESIVSKDKKFLLPVLFIVLFSILYLARYLIKGSQSFLAKNNA
mgnify:CR=1 FL=1